MKIFTALGLMSGTSMDGIDLAILRSDGDRIVERGPSGFEPYTKETRKRIEESLILAESMKDRLSRPGSLAALEHELSDLHYQAVNRFILSNHVKPGDIDLIGFHGQTILHKPDHALTIQLGNGQYLADKTGIEVIFDLRANDMEQGGQGAPLVPVYHAALSDGIADQLSGENAIAFVNIGGISNITYIGNDGELIAFDSGPGNCLIDQWVSDRTGMEFDRNGEIATGGNVNEVICSSYLDHHFFKQSIPKSLDRKDFDLLTDPNISTADGARSLAYLTALTIMHSLGQLPTVPGLIVVCGGGALNPVIMSDLGSMAKPIGAQIVTADDVALSSAAMEAEAFAYLAIRSKLELPITYPMTTGCTFPVSGGVSACPNISVSD